MGETNVEGEAETIRIAAICGSLRPGSYTRRALEIALQGAAEVGAETQLIDLTGYDLGFCGGGSDDHPDSEGLQRLRRNVQAAHGILLGTPIYHGSFSGVLKNALDLMGFREFEGKMIGLLGVSGGRAGAFNALDNLRSEQVSIAEGWQAFDEAGNLKSAELEQRLLELGRQVARFAYLHGSDQAKAFLDAWERAPANPGAESDPLA
jgi:FMN reductase